MLSNFTTLLEKQINTKIQSPRKKIKYNKITTYLGDYSKCSCCGKVMIKKSSNNKMNKTQCFIRVWVPLNR